MRWLIEDFRVENGLGTLADYLKSQKEELHLISYVPFKDVDTSKWSDATPVMVLGSINLCESLWNTRPTWRKGIWANFKNYSALDYLKILGPKCLNHPYTLLPSLQALVDNKWSVFLQHSSDSCIFVRPVDGDKAFTGTVVDMQNLEHQVSSWKNFNHTKDIPLIVATPKPLKAEWRVAVRTIPTPQAVSASLYRLDGNFTTVSGAPQEVLNLAQEVASLLQPDPMFMVDIALTGTEYKVVEINAFSSAAIYAMPVEPLVLAIKETYSTLCTTS